MNQGETPGMSTELEPQIARASYGERDDRGSFGMWAPGVLDEFLAQVLGDRGATAAGAMVGVDHAGAPMINGIIATVERGQTGATAFDRTRWGWVHEMRGTYYADSELIGWYCSRPNVGAVPTEVDVAMHRQFFAGGQYLLICVDPSAALIATYLGNEDGSMVTLGRGDLHALLGVKPIERKKFGISGGVVAASVLGACFGLAAWFLSGAGGWPFS